MGNETNMETAESVVPEYQTDEVKQNDTKFGRQKNRYPPGAFFILVGYLLERFVYYGSFGGVVFYMQRVLQFSASTSSTIKAALEGINYFAPIVGAIIADLYLGKVKTITIICCLYTLGVVTFTLSSITPIMFSLAGIQAAGIGGTLVLGISAGSMKAVYTSLGPDQFDVPEQRRQQQRFFYAFYWMINAGAFLGQFMTAQLRESVQCFGDDCYMLPFLLYCGLMALSTMVFVSGKRFYRELPPDPTLYNSIKCIFYAGKQKLLSKSAKADHWLDLAQGEFDQNLISNIKVALRVMTVYISFPLFWALFFQTGTGMIFQAKRFYDRIGDYRIPPDLSASLNAFLVLILIPLFEFGIYPCLAKKGMLTKTIHRMLLGMVLACVAFIAYGVANLSVEQQIVQEGYSQLNVYNARDCKVSLKASWQPEMLEIDFHGQIKLDIIHLNVSSSTYVVEYGCAGGEKITSDIELKEEMETTVILFPNETYVHKATKDYLKDVNAEAKVRLTSRKSDTEAIQYQLKYKNLVIPVNLVDGETPFIVLSPQNYNIIYNNETVGMVDIRQDGVYDVVIQDAQSLVFNMTSPSSVHMAALLPQFILITSGEVLFSVSCLDFAYSEAPASMKSVLQAFNLFTLSIGLWLLAIITKIVETTKIFEYRASNEAFAYAALVFLNTLLLLFLCKRFYRNKVVDSEKHCIVESLGKDRAQDTGGVDNPAMQEESRL